MKTSICVISVWKIPKCFYDIQGIDRALFKVISLELFSVHKLIKQKQNYWHNKYTIARFSCSFYSNVMKYEQSFTVKYSDGLTRIPPVKDISSRTHILEYLTSNCKFAFALHCKFNCSMNNFWYKLMIWNRVELAFEFYWKKTSTSFQTFVITKAIVWG